MRNTFINTLCELAGVHEDVFLLCGDLGYSVLETFSEKFPDRYLNVGIAEQNLTQVAVGLAREGYNVFTYSIGNFPTLRCMEQIRYDACYHEANVKIVAVGAGYAYGPLGVSHHTTEDIAMLRSIPNIIVCAPADPVEARAAARFMVDHKGPAYIRLNKAGEPIIHGDNERVSIVRGRMLQVKSGRDVAVITTGAVLGLALSAVLRFGRDWSVFSSAFVGGYSSEQLAEISGKYSHIVTVEEHQLSGGFGSSVLEKLSDLRVEGRVAEIPLVRRVGIPDRFVGCAGSQDYLREAAGITEDAIAGWWEGRA